MKGELKSLRPTNNGLPATAAGLVALMALCAGCTSTDDSADRPYELVIPQELSTLDPRFSTRGFDIKVTRLVHAGLVGLDENTLAPIPLVASSWKYVDERTLDVQLRPGARFHSGAPLGPEDVCATIDALKDPALGSPHRAVVRAIGSCTPRSPTKLTIKLSEPRATLLTDLEVPILRRDQVRLPPRPLGDLDGLGPYRLARSSPTEAVLEPADHSASFKPNRGAVIRTVRDENARALRLLAGRADIAPNAISPALLPALEQRKHLSLNARAGANVTYLLMQNDRQVF